MTVLTLLHTHSVPSELITYIKKDFSGSAHEQLSEKTIKINLDIHVTPEIKKVIQEICYESQVDTIFLKEFFHIEQIRLLAFDMDSTLINIECIDEIARACGKMNEVSKITEASMRGEIKNFSDSLIARVKLLEGVPESALSQVYDERLQLNPGAKELIMSAQQRGINTLLVSGGFTFFTNRMKAQLGLNEAYSNTLEIKNSLLTGKVLGPIVDGVAKASYVKKSCEALGISSQGAITFGDGSNDLPMMDISGLSIGYKPKPVVQEKADGTFQFVGLDAVLDLFPAL
jgi:phosphoserine phosphatase